MSHIPGYEGALIFTGGGTGGHYFPAIALAEGVRERWPDLPIVFIGAKRGIEARKLPDSGWPYQLFDVEGVVGRSPVALVGSLWKLWQAKRRLQHAWRQARPRAVIGTGGYGAAPALLAARSLGIPYVLHESNATPGALVRKVSREARRVWCGMAPTCKALPGADTFEVGTPIRAAFLRTFAPPSPEPPLTLLVLGGSGGARPINEAIFERASDLLERHPEWEIRHQAGPREYERLLHCSRHARHHLFPFLEGIDGEMERASLVVSRSGASTCAELRASGKPSILVPFPESAGDHQTMNARAMAELGAARLVIQGPDLAERLACSVSELMVDPGLRAAMTHQEPNQAVKRCLDDLVQLGIAMPS